MATQSVGPNPPTAPFVDMRTGRINPEWWRFLYRNNQNTTAAVEGSITTAAGSGLTGGGTVADGISLSITTNGVSNAMMRQSAGTSVIGRFASTTGNVADITAVQDATVLTRQSGQLAFRPDLDGVSVGPNTAAPLVNTDELRVATQTPASASAAGTAGTIAWDANYLYVCTATNTWKRVAIATWP